MTDNDSGQSFKYDSLNLCSSLHMSYLNNKHNRGSGFEPWGTSEFVKQFMDLNPFLCHKLDPLIKVRPKIVKICY